MNKILVTTLVLFVVGTGIQQPALWAQDVGGNGGAQKNITLTLQQVDIKDAIGIILRGLQYRIDPDVHGTVTASIKDLPVDSALTQVLQNTGYVYDENNGVYHIHAQVTAPNPANPTFPGATYPGYAGANTTPGVNPGYTGQPMNVPGVPAGIPTATPTTGTNTNWTGGLTPPPVPTIASTDTDTGTTEPKVPLTLQPPIRVQHVAPEYIIAVLQWLGSGTSGQSTTGQGGLGTLGMNGNGYGNGMGGGLGGSSSLGTLSLPPTEASILAQEMAQGMQESAAIGSMAQQFGNTMNNGMMNGGYGNNGYGGGYGNNGYGGGYGNNGYGGGYGNNGYGGGYGNSGYGNSGYGGYGNSGYGGGYNGYNSGGYGGGYRTY